MDVSWHGGTEGNFDISLISILLHNPPHCIICSNFFSGIFCSFCCSPFCSTPFFVMYISLFVMYIFFIILCSSCLLLFIRMLQVLSFSVTFYHRKHRTEETFFYSTSILFPPSPPRILWNTSLHPLDLEWCAVNTNSFFKNVRSEELKHCVSAITQMKLEDYLST